MLEIYHRGAYTLVEKHHYIVRNYNCQFVHKWFFSRIVLPLFFIKIRSHYYIQTAFYQASTHPAAFSSGFLMVTMVTMNFLGLKLLLRRFLIMPPATKTILLIKIFPIPPKAFQILIQPMNVRASPQQPKLKVLRRNCSRRTKKLPLSKKAFVLLRNTVIFMININLILHII